MFRSLDRNTQLLRLVKWLSTSLARHRGLPVVVGIALVIVSFVLQTINVYNPSQILALLGVIAHHVGLLVALIGLLLAEPLGK
jgi:hypothetical protein